MPAPGGPSDEAIRIASAVRSGQLPTLPGETVEQAVLRYLQNIGEGGRASAARSAGASVDDLLKALQMQGKSGIGSSAGTMPVK